MSARSKPDEDSGGSLITHAVVVERSEEAATLRFTLTSEHTAGIYALAEGNFAPGAGAPPHRHTRESEAFHIVAGRMRFEVGDDTVDAGPGSTVFLPVGVPHAFRNLGDEPCRFVLVVTPAGLERFFGEAAVLAGESASPQELDALANSYGIEDASTWYACRRSNTFAFEL